MINVKLNIIEPWKYGTRTAAHATIVKSDNEVFLLSLEVSIIIKGETARYFICKLKGIETNKLISNQTEGIFPISMVFDKSLKDATTELPLFENYRSNFLSGEVVKKIAANTSFYAIVVLAIILIRISLMSFRTVVDSRTVNTTTA